MSEAPGWPGPPEPDRPQLSGDRVKYAGLPLAEFGTPGRLRDRLLAAIFDGSKTTTTGALAAYQLEGDPLPVAGGRELVVDSDGQVVAVIEITEVRIAPKREVDLQFAIDEGEGFTTIEAWWDAHVAFFESPEVRAAVGDPAFTIDAESDLVLLRFRLVERLD